MQAEFRGSLGQAFTDMYGDLTGKFELRVADMDRDNIGQEKFLVVINGPLKTEENLRWCDIALVTGTTMVNGIFEQFKISKPVIFCGITFSGAANLLGLNYFCHCGH
ncbi:MAG TPA: DUF364 domain-containing protein [Desulfobacteraceae bacterium]|nr:DUF364 domain-containing protein [Desulfobacteraceae bacterium]HPJ68923.1 DUF364 domain-containing protein [Desulfobacteraceae bacterium]HPQ27897.1 DUF364 domain-containing protein [Desulfobacteraceae bacterium]